ncbi:MAG: PKD domain-containing protein [Thermoplasmata archaeon]|nr:PKD domain-containing protein [Thermoplasmata archaeon]
MISWYNETANIGPGPNGYLGMAAFDPLLGAQGGEMVYFGGCDFTTGCLSNATWLYDGLGWTQVVTSTAPPPLWGAGFAFDPTAGAVILYGGENNGGVAVQQVWEFNATGWTNLTGTSWGNGAYDVAFESMAWDPALKELILADGCSSACSAFYDGTDALTSTGITFLGSGPGGSNSYEDAASMTWDGVDNAMVYFGGASFGTGGLNTTYALEGTTWVDVSLPPPACTICLVPPAQDYAAISWDQALGEVVMFGGHNTTTNVWYNTTWEFDLTNGWDALDLFFNVNPPPPTVWGTMALNSSDDSVLFLEGGCAGGPSPPSSCAGADVVLENSPFPYVQGNASASVDLGHPFTLPLANPTGFGSGPWVFELVDWGDLQISGANQYNLTNGENWSYYPSHVYAALGNYTAVASLVDFYDVSGNISWNITVRADPLITASAVPSTTEPGALVAFSANLTLGQPPYTYAWNFAETTSGTGASISHHFAAAGTYMVNVTGTDHTGVSVSFLLPVTVDPTLHVSSSAVRSTLDAGVMDSLTGSASGGSGSYSTYSWHFGDGQTGTGATAGHSFASAGVYNVTLNLTDSLGFVATSTVAVHVDPALAIAPTENRTSVTPGGSVGFSAGASGGTPPNTYSWQFGDGSTATVASPTHVFATAGSFVVKLWANDSGGDSLAKELNVTVAKTVPPGGSGGGSSGLGSNTLLYIVLAAVVVAAVLAVLLLARRRKPSPPENAATTSASAPPEPGPGSPPPGAS